MSFGETESPMSLPSREDSAPPPKISVRPIAGTWHQPLFLTRDRWFESGSLHRGVSISAGSSHGRPRQHRQRTHRQEDLAPLLFQDLRIGEGAPVDAKDAAGAIVDDQVLH